MIYPTLHTSIHIGPLLLKNRLVMPPMATEKSAEGRVTDALCEYYDTMTHGGYLGLVVTEHSYVSPEGKASPYQLSIADDSTISGLSRIVDVIHKNNVPVMAQINHAGSAAKKIVSGFETKGPSAVKNPGPVARRRGDPVIPIAMSEDEVKRIIQCYIDAAVRAERAGYDGVEIHSAHGYLLNQFYSPLTNVRSDAYTGSTLSGRTKVHREILRGVRERVSKDFAISVRFGAADYMEGGAMPEEAPEAARLLVEAGADMLSISGGMCAYSRPGHEEQGYFAELSSAVKKAVQVPVLLAGGITDGQGAEDLLKNNQADLIGIGRAFLKDPSLPEKIMTAQ